jgi:GNAT superfamily N-acetyltransferase
MKPGDAAPDRLRIAMRDDIPEMEALIRRSALGLPAPYTAAQAAAMTEHVYGVDTQLVDDGTYFVIEREGRIVACGGWSRRGTMFGGDQTKHGADPLLDPARDPARIRAFFVDPAMARRGLGRMLLDASENAARAEGFTRLTLVATGPGEPLYAVCGFIVEERFELELPGVRVPVARMEKHLGPSAED